MRCFKQGVSPSMSDPVRLGFTLTEEFLFQTGREPQYV